MGSRPPTLLREDVPVSWSNQRGVGTAGAQEGQGFGSLHRLLSATPPLFFFSSEVRAAQ